MSVSAVDYSHSERLRGLIAAISCISVVGLAFGLGTPLLALFMERAGVSTTLIGVNIALHAGSALMATPFTPLIIRTLGLSRALIASAVIIGLCFIAFKATETHIWMWYPLRFFSGVAAAILFVGSETWINAIARDEERGRILGLYATALALGFGLGPAVLWLTGFDGWTPFIAGALICFLALVPLVLIPAARRDAFGHGAVSFFRLIPVAPATFASAAIFGAVETAILNLAPIYLVRLDYVESAAAFVIMIYGAGTITFQFAIGALADRYGYMRLLGVCAAVGVAGAALLPAASGSFASLFGLLFVWGGVIVGLYTVGLAQLGRIFSGPNLGAANAGYVFMYSAGALTGPLLSGASMDLVGPHGLALAVAVLLIAYAVLLSWRRTRPSP